MASYSPPASQRGFGRASWTHSDACQSLNKHPWSIDMAATSIGWDSQEAAKPGAQALAAPLSG